MDNGELTAKVRRLTDRQAVQAVLYLGKTAQSAVVDTEIAELGADVTEDEALEILAQTLPGVGEAVEGLSADAASAERGRLSRDLLLVLSADDHNSKVVSEAVEKASLAFPPALVLAAAVLFVLTTDFSFERKEIDGKAHTEWKVSRKASSSDQLKLIFHPAEALERVAGIFTGADDPPPARKDASDGTEHTERR